MRRREFLGRFGSLAAGGALAASGLPFALAPARARAATSGKTLVVVFLRGGCDGLNAIVPHGDDDYYALRPNISIAPPSAGDPDSAIDLDGFFGLHPALGGLESAWLDGDLAVLPSVHLPDASHSHFVGQDELEQGSTQGASDGWLNRYVATSSATATLRAVSFGVSTTVSLRGPTPVMTVSSLDQHNIGLDAVREASLVQRLESLIAQPIDPRQPYATAMHDTADLLWKGYEAIEAIDIDAYGPANGAVYPDTQFGRALRDAAVLIKADVGLEIATLDLGGWDTHVNQGGAAGNQAVALAALGDGLGALHQDLAGRMDDVVVLAMSEFGRSAAQNVGFGTDHGGAAAWLALGGPVTGGLYTGVAGWPGLDPDSLADGRELAHTIDSRDVMAEVLARHLGAVDLSIPLPGHTYAPVEFLPG